MSTELLIFIFFSLLLVFSALKVIIVNNSVKAAIFLVLSFFCSAVLWLLMNAEFLSIILILVYVGAVMVLFLFVVMMLDINLSNIKEKFVNYLPLGLFIFLVIALLLILFFDNQFSDVDRNIVTEINILNDNNTMNLGYLLFTEYIIAFEIAGIILLLGIISSITLTQQKNNDNKYQAPHDQINVTKSDRLKIIKDEEFRK
ncbi:MAG: NADH:ubiquinone oxidoreductase subunit J [Gammaproteobacteria bacterium]|nr:NADH:ubiquinone oxidoreductase subunit J [Gammaproteobacteria bacterium]|tara:strand:+ start:141647 stop:142249 length:603 start_codon:yes stop_codon:yes gene_type:complete